MRSHLDGIGVRCDCRMPSGTCVIRCIWWDNIASPVILDSKEHWAVKNAIVRRFGSRCLDRPWFVWDSLRYIFMFVIDNEHYMIRA